MPNEVIIGVLDWFIDNLYWIIPGGIIFLIWSRLRNRQPITLGSGKTINLKELALIFELALIILGLILLQVWFFSDHWFFILAFLFFTPIMAMVFVYVLQRDNIYILETAIQGQELIDLTRTRRLIVPRTQNRLMVMDRADYEAKDHIGDVRTPWWNFNRLIFTDYYDQETGTFYHSEYNVLKNITFYQARAVWLKLLKVIPDVMKKNAELTIMGEIRLGDAIRQMVKQFPFWLAEMDEQHPEPFNLVDMENLLEKSRAEKYKDINTQVREAMAEIEDEIKQGAGPDV